MSVEKNKQELLKLQKERSMAGKLYGVGVGPGDPELITLKALRLTKEADILAFPGEMTPGSQWHTRS